MGKKSQLVQLGRRKFEISNLEKVLYPQDQITKAEIIQYYLNVAPVILKHLRGRALSLIRYPDGVHGEHFYQKNRPDWAPDWIQYVSLGKEEKKDYIIATEESSLAWLANLACLELHQMQTRQPDFDKPDYFVLDLDPPEQYDFSKVVDLAFELKEHLLLHDYHCFAKTTGGKGIHLLVPLIPKYSYEDVFEALQDLVKPFVKKHSGSTTLQIKKDARGGKILIDIYRNRSSQTIIAAYSLRGRDGAPVSTPIEWDDLTHLESSSEFNIKTVPRKLAENGDPWENMGAYAAVLHTRTKSVSTRSSLPSSVHHKSPEQLSKYKSKRQFEKTPEPQGAFKEGFDSAFVIHRHHATRLHYDLRLEEGGVLKSWAVPKGLPPEPGIRRLAMETEDHPIEYLEFEGTIPKGEYGGGEMWIFLQGRHHISKKKKNGFYFEIYSQQLTATYRIHNTSQKSWLLERVDKPLKTWLDGPVKPMLAELTRKIPNSKEYQYEVKWDGIRALIVIREGEIKIWSRNQNDITDQFPELLNHEKSFYATTAVFDGEIVCLDEKGRPDFRKVINRLQAKSGTDYTRLVKSNPAMCYLFDCLYLDGRAITDEPIERRRSWMIDSVKQNDYYRISETMEDGVALFEAVKKMGMEGIMAKCKNSRYLPGKRSENWLKVKVRKTADCLVIGFTEGKGERMQYFGALHLGQYEKDKLVYRGKVGTGFDQELMKKISDQLTTIKKISRPIEKKPVDNAVSVWLEPKLCCEITYSSITVNDTFREPVFLKLRPDLTPEDIST